MRAIFGTMLRTAGRAAIGGAFASMGWRLYRDPAPRAALVEGSDLPLPLDPETAVKLNGLVMTVGGGAIALGAAPRLGALAVAAALVPTTYVGHAFWAVDDPQVRAQQRTHFFKNLAMFGGLLAIAGTPSTER